MGKKQNLPPLYIPSTEHDSCGVGFIANLEKEANHKVIEMGLTALENLTHRGAVGGDANTGDGAGLLFQVPHEFFQSIIKELKGFNCGDYGVGQIFFPNSKDEIKKCLSIINDITNKEGYEIISTRDVPTDDSTLGDIAKNSQPHIKQVFFRNKSRKISEQGLYILRRTIENEIDKKCPESKENFYFCTLSSRTKSVTRECSLRISCLCIASLRAAFDEAFFDANKKAFLIGRKWKTSNKPSERRFAAHCGIELLSISPARHGPGWPCAPTI